MKNNFESDFKNIKQQITYNDNFLYKRKLYILLARYLTAEWLEISHVEETFRCTMKYESFQIYISIRFEKLYEYGCKFQDVMVV